jgi:uncharacterized protein YjbJ (UPF0337 family)
MNTDRIAATATQAVGRVVAFFGKMVADLEAVAGRRGKKAEGKVQDAVSDVKNTARHAPADTQ